VHAPSLLDFGEPTAGAGGGGGGAGTLTIFFCCKACQFGSMLKDARCGNSTHLHGWPPVLTLIPSVF
jgi:hypothetical protein